MNSLWRPRVDLESILAVGFRTSIIGIAASSAATGIVVGDYAWMTSNGAGPNTFAYGVALPALLWVLWHLSKRLSETGRFRFTVGAALLAPPATFGVNYVASHDGQGALQEYILVGLLIAFAFPFRLAWLLVAWDLAWVAANLWSTRPATSAAVDFASVSILLVLVVVVIVVFRRQQELVEQRLYKASHTDALTGLGTRRTLHEAAEHVIATEQRYALLVFDVDNFTQYNTAHGHLGGDAVLRVIARELAEAVEPNQVYRTGGDEFVALLLDHGRGGAKRVATRAARAVKNATATLEDGTVVNNLAVSYGVAGLDARTPFDTAFSSADADLYASRRHRRGALIGG